MVTYIIIGITVLVSLLSFSNQSLLSRLIFNPYEIKRKKQYYRFVTSGFIHADYFHLFFNCLTLFFFGVKLEATFQAIFGAVEGALLYIVLYLAAMIVADLKAFFQYRDDYNYNALGASGAVSGVLFSSILFYPLEKLYLMFIPIGIPGYLFGILYLIYSYYSGKRMADNIGHDAHFYGAIFGIAFTIGIYPDVVEYFFEQLGKQGPF